MNSGRRPPRRTRPVTSRPLLIMLDDAALAHAVEVGGRDIDALRREQFDERPAGEFARVVAEQRLGAAVGRDDRAGASSTITPSVAVSRMARSSAISAPARGGVRLRLCGLLPRFGHEALSLRHRILGLGDGRLRGGEFVRRGRKLRLAAALRMRAECVSTSNACAASLSHSTGMSSDLDVFLIAALRRSSARKACPGAASTVECCRERAEGSSRPPASTRSSRLSWPVACRKARLA